MKKIIAIALIVLCVLAIGLILNKVLDAWVEGKNLDSVIQEPSSKSFSQILESKNESLVPPPQIPEAVK